MEMIHELRLFHYPNKIRYGDNGDGGYVVADLDIKYDCYISAGIAEEESFTRDFLQAHSYVGRENSYAFDGTIDDYPWEYTSEIQFITKNIGIINDCNTTNLEYLAEKYNNIFLNMDIEGHEFDWIGNLSEEHLKKFKQLTIEIHDTNSDNYTGGSVKIKLEEKARVLNKLNQTHYLIHAHGNNHCDVEQLLYNNGRYSEIVFIPKVLELTFVIKDFFDEPLVLNRQMLPIIGLDYPNQPANNEILLYKYPFVNK